MLLADFLFSKKYDDDETLSPELSLREKVLLPPFHKDSRELWGKKKRKPKVHMG